MASVLPRLFKKTFMEEFVITMMAHSDALHEEHKKLVDYADKSQERTGEIYKLTEKVWEQVELLIEKSKEAKQEEKAKLFRLEAQLMIIKAERLQKYGEMSRDHTTSMLRAADKAWENGVSLKMDAKFSYFTEPKNIIPTVDSQLSEDKNLCETLMEPLSTFELMQELAFYDEDNKS